MPRARPPLDYALLGLLNQQPASGYALRRIFQSTPMGIYSDSPGSIYPALRRLHAHGWIRGSTEGEGRVRTTYRIATAGRRALRKWLESPLTYEEVAARDGGAELRLAFLSDCVGPSRVREYLLSFAALVDRLHDALAGTRALIAPKLTPSAAIALDLGITLTRARAAACRRAARQLRSAS